MDKAVLEGLLFVVGEDGLTLNQIESVLEIDEESSKNLIMELKKDYEDIFGYANKHIDMQSLFL